MQTVLICLPSKIILNYMKLHVEKIHSYGTVKEKGRFRGSKNNPQEEPTDRSSFTALGESSNSREETLRPKLWNVISDDFLVEMKD